MSGHERSDGPSGDLHRLRRGIVAVLVLIAALAAADIALDAPTNWLTGHIVLELTLVAVSIGSALALWLGWRRTADDLMETREALANRSAEAASWRLKAESALAGMAVAIDEQFTVWQLTPAEREVALGILRGAGHKQIAAATGRSERTVRQHAVAVYEKSGCGGRAELAAFFLGGLRIPGAP